MKLGHIPFIKLLYIQWSLEGTNLGLTFFSLFNICEPHPLLLIPHPNKIAA